jgi:hypothetical protein
MRHPRESGDLYGACAKALDSRLRGNDNTANGDASAHKQALLANGYGCYLDHGEVTPR